jgi:oxygen-independent coproporphyrinogen-3 oxidase
MSQLFLDYDLIKKYDRSGPRYTSYPPANFFQSGFNEASFIDLIQQSNQQKPRNLSFYFHVPFCPQLCNFCGCNSELMRDKATTERYFEMLKKEFVTVASYLDSSRFVSQVHWGGGTPNAVPMRFITGVMELIRAHFAFTPDAEIAMECNPAYMTLTQIEQLAEIGFNRISLGIQDFEQQVLSIIHRKPSKLPIEKVIESLHKHKMQVNLDFVYGLPTQTSEKFQQTIDHAIALNPERIVTFSYAHVPWIKSAQKVLEQHILPSAKEKLSLFHVAYERMTNAGYDAIGLDHFARPHDEMSQALHERTLHRNFMGYCTRSHSGQVYAFGASSITQLENAYVQNNKNTDAYMGIISRNGLAPEKGYVLTETDKVCRLIIEELMCNQYIDLDQIAMHCGLTYEQLIAVTTFSSESLQPMIDDHLVTWSNHQLTVLPSGRMILRNVAMLFDPLLQNTTMRYSRTV